VPPLIDTVVHLSFSPSGAARPISRHHEAGPDGSPQPGQAQCSGVMGSNRPPPAIRYCRHCLPQGCVHCVNLPPPSSYPNTRNHRSRQATSLLAANKDDRTLVYSVPNLSSPNSSYLQRCISVRMIVPRCDGFTFCVLAIVTGGDNREYGWWLGNSLSPRGTARV